MFKTTPFTSEKVWGYEKWIVSTHLAGQSDAVISEEKAVPLSEKIGEDFPLLVKLIQTDEKLSVQVHPDDEYAARVEKASGKTECWYILDAEPGASLVCGMKASYTRDELSAAIRENRLDEYLRNVPVKKGDFVYIPAGTVHAIRGGIRLLEVQQPSDITYRLYDWGRPRETHVEKALDVIKTDIPDLVNNFDGVFKCDYFTLEKNNAIGSVEITSDFGFLACTTPSGAMKAKTPAANRGWLTLFILEGSGTLTSSDCSSLNVKTEDTVMFKADERLLLTPRPGTRIRCMKIG